MALGIGRGAGRWTICGAIWVGGSIPIPRGILTCVSGGIRKGVMRAISGASAEASGRNKEVATHVTFASGKS